MAVGLSGKSLEVDGTFTATGQSETFTFVGGTANLWLSGGVGTVKLQASYNAGSTWFDVGRDDAGVFTLSAGQAFVEFIEETEPGLDYRLNCTAYTSGTITYRVSQ